MEPGWIALVFSLFTTTVQVLTWWRGRHRITATLSQGVGAKLVSDELISVDLACVTVHAVGRSCRVEEIIVEWTDKEPQPVEGFQYGHTLKPSAMDELQAGELTDLKDLLGIRKTLADGELETWRYNISTTSRAATSRPRRFRARVTLNSGKELLTNHAYIRPSLIPTGNVVGELPNAD